MREGLVSRLRREGSNALMRHLSMGMWQLCSEAANRIEELEAKVRELEKRPRVRRAERPPIVIQEELL